MQNQNLLPYANTLFIEGSPLKFVSFLYTFIWLLLQVYVNHWYWQGNSQHKLSSVEFGFVNLFPGATGRASLIEVSERKARKVRFFINADKFFKGAVIAVSGEKFRTFDRLLEHMSRIMCNQVKIHSTFLWIHLILTI